MKCPSEVAVILAEILKLGLLRIRSFGLKKNAARCAIEADHVHNLPFLLANFSDDLLRFYLDVERTSFLQQASADAEIAFGSLWRHLDNSLSSHIRNVERQLLERLNIEQELQ